MIQQITAIIGAVVFLAVNHWDTVKPLLAKLRFKSSITPVTDVASDVAAIRRTYALAKQNGFGELLEPLQNLAGVCVTSDKGATDA